MIKNIKYVFDNWEDELLGLTHEAVECAIASAYINIQGVDFLSRVAQRLAKYATLNSSIIKIILSDKFAPTDADQLHILKKLSELPGVEARVYCNDHFLHRKNYIFRSNDEIRVVVGSVNITSAGLFNNLEIATISIHANEDPEVTRIYDEFKSIWSKAKPSNIYMEALNVSDINPKFSEGQNVRYISNGKIGTINKLLKGSREYQYKVTLDGKPHMIAEHSLEPVIDIEDNVIQEFTKGNFGNYTDYRLFQTWFRLSKPLESNLYSYLGSKTIFNPYQFKPLLKFLSSGSDDRLFIADEVGVGKTIETGIIIKELLARGQLDNHTPILIVCPHSLGPKWVKEMKDRFMLDFHLHDGGTLSYTLKDLMNTGIYPQKYIYSIVGLELIRREEYRALLRELDSKRDEPVFGLVVIDEAHHLRNFETDSNELGNLLSEQTERMLMLSATPLNLRNEDLFNQMHILNHSAFPDILTFQTLYAPVIQLNGIRRLIAKNTTTSHAEIISRLQELKNDRLGKLICNRPQVINLINRLNNGKLFTIEEVVSFERLFNTLSPLYNSFTRTCKREALKHQVEREVWSIPISLSEREMRFHNDVIATLLDYYLSNGYDPKMLGFLINTYRRMVSSCIPAMKEYLEWCVRDNRELDYAKVRFEDIESDIEDDNELDIRKLDPILKEKFILMIKEAKELEGTDNKYIQFKQMIDKILANNETPQVLVFSFFIRTLEYLKRRLEADGYSVGIIHGGIPVDDRKVINRYDIMEEFKKGSYKILLSSEVGEQGLDFQYCHAIINYDLPYNPMRIEQRIGRIDRFGQSNDKIIVANLFIQGTVDEEIYDRLYRRIRIVEDGVGALEPIIGKEMADIQTALITGTLREDQKEERQKRLEKSVQSSKAENEEFENDRKDLLGDDYLLKPINSLKTNAFVSPDDAMQLTEQCLSGWEGCECKRIDENSCQILLSENILSRLDKFLRRSGNETGYPELKQLIINKKYSNVVFDGSLALNLPG